eukprot:TRINITY_DN16356_c0_g1_i1.p1 TRINITY_DN16356_c0_g1~~TRINITY_DN16356_c0_g1_i1.p1  ORF type:complete len:146 (-),score=43.02 TRINITY_DN16356_c0_g1_i1:23-460(-)
MDPNMNSFVEKVNKFTPTVPNEAIDYFLRKSGFNSTDPLLKKLISISAQRFISIIAKDCFEERKLNQDSKMTKKMKKLTLTNSDLAKITGEYGIHINKPTFFSDKIVTGTQEQPKQPKRKKSSQNVVKNVPTKQTTTKKRRLSKN